MWCNFYHLQCSAGGGIKRSRKVRWEDEKDIKNAETLLKMNASSTKLFSEEGIYFSVDIIVTLFAEHLSSGQGKFPTWGGSATVEEMKKMVRSSELVMFEFLHGILRRDYLFTINELIHTLYLWTLQGNSFQCVVAKCHWVGHKFSTLGSKFSTVVSFVHFLNDKFSVVLCAQAVRSLKIIRRSMKKIEKNCNDMPPGERYHKHNFT